MTTPLLKKVEKLEALKAKIASAVSPEDMESLDDLVQDIARTATVDALEQRNAQVKRVPMGGGDAEVKVPQRDWAAPIKVATQWGEKSISGFLIRNPEASGAALDGQFRWLGEFMRTVFDSNMSGRLDPRLKALGEVSGGDGGFLVPEEFRAQLLALELEEALVRPMATIMPMSRLETRIPAVHDTSHATNVYGGVQVNWAQESSTVTEAAPTFKQILLVAKKLMGDTSVANELLSDSAIALESLLAMMFSKAMAFFEDEAFINGTGAGQPLGVLNAPALVSVTKETGQAATTIVAENLDKMYSRLLPRSKGRAVWLAHPDTFPQLASLSRPVGTGGSAVFVTNISSGPPNTIYGRPVVFTEHCQTLGTVGDIYLVDLSYYLIGDRQALSIDASPHVRFRNDETVWRFIERLDGRPWLESALTPRYGSSTLSPFVALATRA